MAFDLVKTTNSLKNLILVIIAIQTISEIAFSKVMSRKLLQPDLRFLDVKMPEVKPLKNDDYICTAKSVSDNDLYIVQFEPHADVSRVHHMLLFGCSDLFDSQQLYPGYWNCGHSKLCPGMTIMYAWGKNAPTLHLPEGVGFKTGAKKSINYLILQVHYAHLLPEGDSDSSGVTLHYTYTPQKFIAGIHLLSSNNGFIPPHEEKYSVDVNCVVRDSEPIYPFAYRVHAHELGVVITGYKYNQKNDSWTLLAKGNPQWPQTFYPMEQIYSVNRDEVLSARCTYNSSSRPSITVMGSTAGDEMCNLYLMYYTNSKVGRSFGLCVDVQFKDLVLRLPVGSDEPLPKNPELEEHAHNHFSNNRAVSGQRSKYSYSEASGWPFGSNLFGQVTAVDVKDNNNILIFHRGKHVWNARTFDATNKYRLIDEGPIDTNTIIEIDPKSKKVVNHWASNLFYLPHGLTLDRNGSIWLTDVALHQVFKYPENGSQQPILTIGERFVTGSDENHFCKPTSVAINSLNGDIYVADGYCNSRVVRFNSKGEFLNQFGHSDRMGYFGNPAPSALSVPHKVVLIEDKKLSCVADREHGRIQCFNIPNGEFQFQILREEFNGRLFSISYSRTQGLLYAVCGPSLYDKKDVKAFVFNITDRKMVAMFAPNSGSFAQPHDIAVSKDGQTVYVVEIGPNNIWAFNRNTDENTGSDDDIQKVSKKEFTFHTPIEVIPHSQQYVNNQVFIKSEPLIQKNPSNDGPVVDQNVIPIVNQSVNQSVRLQTDSSSLPTFMTSSNTSIVVSLLVIPVLILIIVSIVINMRRSGRFDSFKAYICGKSQEKYDLGRLLGGDPKKDGFNRVPIDESDGDLDENSDSEVEEYNISSASAARKV